MIYISVNELKSRGLPHTLFPEDEGMLEIHRSGAIIVLHKEGYKVNINHLDESNNRHLEEGTPLEMGEKDKFYLQEITIPGQLSYSLEKIKELEKEHPITSFKDLLNHLGIRFENEIGQRHELETAVA